MATPFRDDDHALRQRLAALDAELRDARALSEKARAADAARGRLEAERADVAARLGALGNGFSLEGLRIASPCKADWDAMAGDERVRFCGQCEKNVYNLSGMRRDEAEALVRGVEGSICVRLYKRDDGTVLTSDCPEGVSRKRRRRLALVAGSGALAAASAVASFGRSAGGGWAGGVSMGEAPGAIGGALEVPTPLETIGQAPAGRKGSDDAGAIVGEWAAGPPPKPVHSRPLRGAAVRLTPKTATPRPPPKAPGARK